MGSLWDTDTSDFKLTFSDISLPLLRALYETNQDKDLLRYLFNHISQRAYVEIGDIWEGRFLESFSDLNEVDERVFLVKHG